MADINGILGKMRAAGKFQDMKGKGDAGEEAVLQICYDRLQAKGRGMLYQSFMYPYQTNRAGVCYTGNVMYENDIFVDYSSDSINDEIDVLYCTPYRIFPIEVKSYHSRKLYVYDHWFNKDSTIVQKSPIAQAEKHARHLYHAIHSVLPDGDTEYIIPLVCFVDRCTVIDERTPEMQEYVPVCILNNLRSVINKHDKPLSYDIDLPALTDKLNKIKVSIKRTM